MVGIPSPVKFGKKKTRAAKQNARVVCGTGSMRAGGEPDGIT
jgi:hypothetical protein